MPRPTKCRRVCDLPQSNAFGPYDNMHKDKPTVVMSIEEFETIRLIDYENMTQEDCAEKMDVARTTVQRIYADARAKLAKVIVECNKLTIEGGNFKVCKKDKPHCHHDKCLKNRGEKFMIIAVATEKNMVSEHFGHCESFTFFKVEDNKIINTENILNPKSGHGSLAGFLKDKNTSVVISGGMGEGAFNGLKSVGIEIVTGVKGETEQAVLQFLDGKLVTQGIYCSENHHGHGGGCHGHKEHDHKHNDGNCNCH